MLKAIYKPLKKQNVVLITNVICIIIFSYIYYMIAQTQGSQKDKENFKTLEDSLYYTTITHFTIGFGDISPESKTMRRLTMLQVLIAFLLMNNLLL
jgi:uncharacterized membrane protein